MKIKTKNKLKIAGLIGIVLLVLIPSAIQFGTGQIDDRSFRPSASEVPDRNVRPDPPEDLPTEVPYDGRGGRSSSQNPQDGTPGTDGNFYDTTLMSPLNRELMEFENEITQGLSYPSFNNFYNNPLYPVEYDIYINNDFELSDPELDPNGMWFSASGAESPFTLISLCERGQEYCEGEDNELIFDNYNVRMAPEGSRIIWDPLRDEDIGTYYDLNSADPDVMSDGLEMRTRIYFHNNGAETRYPGSPYDPGSTDALNAEIGINYQNQYLPYIQGFIKADNAEYRETDGTVITDELGVINETTDTASIYVDPDAQKNWELKFDPYHSFIRMNFTPDQQISCTSNADCGSERTCLTDIGQCAQQHEILYFSEDYEQIGEYTYRAQAAPGAIPNDSLFAQDLVIEGFYEDEEDVRLRPVLEWNVQKKWARVKFLGENGLPGCFRFSGTAYFDFYFVEKETPPAPTQCAELGYIPTDGVVENGTVSLGEAYEQKPQTFFEYDVPRDELPLYINNIPDLAINTNGEPFNGPVKIEAINADGTNRNAGKFKLLTDGSDPVTGAVINIANPQRGFDLIYDNGEYTTGEPGVIEEGTTLYIYSEDLSTDCRLTINITEPEPEPEPEPICADIGFGVWFADEEEVNGRTIYRPTQLLSEYENVRTTESNLPLYIKYNYEQFLYNNGERYDKPVTIEVIPDEGSGILLYSTNDEGTPIDPPIKIDNPQTIVFDDYHDNIGYIITRDPNVEEMGEVVINFYADEVADVEGAHPCKLTVTVAGEPGPPPPEPICAQIGFDLYEAETDADGNYVPGEFIGTSYGDTWPEEINEEQFPIYIDAVKSQFLYTDGTRYEKLTTVEQNPINGTFISVLHADLDQYEILELAPGRQDPDANYVLEANEGASLAGTTVKFYGLNEGPGSPCYYEFTVTPGAEPICEQIGFDIYEADTDAEGNYIPGEFIGSSYGDVWPEEINEEQFPIYIDSMESQYRYNDGTRYAKLTTVEQDPVNGTFISVLHADLDQYEILEFGPQRLDYDANFVLEVNEGASLAGTTVKFYGLNEGPGSPCYYEFTVTPAEVELVCADIGFEIWSAEDDGQGSYVPGELISAEGSADIQESDLPLFIKYNSEGFLYDNGDLYDQRIHIKLFPQSGSGVDIFKIDDLTVGVPNVSIADPQTITFEDPNNPGYVVLQREGAEISTATIEFYAEEVVDLDVHPCKMDITITGAAPPPPVCIDAELDKHSFPVGESQIFVLTVNADDGYDTPFVWETNGNGTFRELDPSEVENMYYDPIQGTTLYFDNTKDTVKSTAKILENPTSAITTLKNSLLVAPRAFPNMIDYVDQPQALTGFINPFELAASLASPKYGEACEHSQDCGYVLDEDGNIEIDDNGDYMKIICTDNICGGIGGYCEYNQQCESGYCDLDDQSCKVYGSTFPGLEDVIDRPEFIGGPPSPVELIDIPEEEPITSLIQPGGDVTFIEEGRLPSTLPGGDGIGLLPGVGGSNPLVTDFNNVIVVEFSGGDADDWVRVYPLGSANPEEDPCYDIAYAEEEIRCERIEVDPLTYNIDGTPETYSLAVIPPEYEGTFNWDYSGSDGTFTTDDTQASGQITTDEKVVTFEGGEPGELVNIVASDIRDAEACNAVITGPTVDAVCEEITLVSEPDAPLEEFEPAVLSIENVTPADFQGLYLWEANEGSLTPAPGTSAQTVTNGIINSGEPVIYTGGPAGREQVTVKVLGNEAVCNGAIDIEAGDLYCADLDIVFPESLEADEETRFRIETVDNNGNPYEGVFTWYTNPEDGEFYETDISDAERVFETEIYQTYFTGAAAGTSIYVGADTGGSACEDVLRIPEGICEEIEVTQDGDEFTIEVTEGEYDGDFVWTALDEDGDEICEFTDGDESDNPLRSDELEVTLECDPDEFVETIQVEAVDFPEECNFEIVFEVVPPGDLEKAVFQIENDIVLDEAIVMDGDTVQYTLEYEPEKPEVARDVRIWDTIGLEGVIYSSGGGGTISYIDGSMDVFHGDDEIDDNCNDTENPTNVCYQGDIGDPDGVKIFNVTDDIRIVYEGLVETVIDDEFCELYEGEECGETFINTADGEEYFFAEDIPGEGEREYYGENPLDEVNAIVYSICPFFYTAEGDILLETGFDTGFDLSQCFEIPNVEDTVVVPKPPVEITPQTGGREIQEYSHSLCKQEFEEELGDIPAGSPLLDYADPVDRLSSLVCEVATQVAEEWQRVSIEQTVEESITRASRFNQNLNFLEDGIFPSGRFTDEGYDFVNNLAPQNEKNPNPENQIFVKTNGDLIIGAPGTSTQVSGSKAKTVVVIGHDLFINSNIVYDPNSPNASIAFVVLDGTINIDPSVEELSGVYYVQSSSSDAGFIASTNDESSKKQLTITGQVYGDINPLITKRKYVGDPTKGGGNVVISYDARILSNTPPALTEFINLQAVEVAR